MAKIFGVHEKTAVNEVINSNFDFWQRGLTSSPTGLTPSYAADRWQVGRSGSGSGNTMTATRQAGFAGSQYCMRIQRNNGDTTAGAGVCAFYSQETRNSIKMAGKKMTISFWARAGANFSASGGLIDWAVRFGTGTDENVRNGFTGNTSQSASFALTTTATKYSFTVDVPSNCTQWGFFVTAIATGTAGAADYYEITQVMVNEGPLVQPHVLSGNDAAGEFLKCQRYYKKSYPIDTTPGTANIDAGLYCYKHFSTSLANDHRWATYVAGTPMRAIPTGVIYDYAGNQARTSDYNTNNSNGANSGQYFAGSLTEYAGTFIIRQLTGGVVTLGANQMVSYHYTLDADL
jgi:hypothetical protein